MSIFAAHMLPVLANGIVEDICARLSGAEEIQSPWHRFPVPVFFVRLGPMDPMVPAATMAANIPKAATRRWSRCGNQVASSQCYRLGTLW